MMFCDINMLEFTPQNDVIAVVKICIEQLVVYISHRQNNKEG